MRRAPGRCISRSMPGPVKRPMGLSPSRIGETSVHTLSANAMTATLPAIGGPGEGLVERRPQRLRRLPGLDHADRVTHHGEGHHPEVAEKERQPVGLGPVRGADALRTGRATRRPAAAVTADSVTTYAQYVKTRPARTCARPPFLANTGTQNAARPTNPVATWARTRASHRQAEDGGQSRCSISFHVSSRAAVLRVARGRQPPVDRGQRLVAPGHLRPDGVDAHPERREVVEARVAVPGRVAAVARRRRRARPPGAAPASGSGGYGRAFMNARVSRRSPRASMK